MLYFSVLKLFSVSCNKLNSMYIIVLNLDFQLICTYFFYHKYFVNIIWLVPLALDSTFSGF